MLALSVPALAYLLQLSPASLRDFANIVALFHPEVIRGIAVCLLWMLAHHVLAGVHHSLFDIHVGTSLHAARINCWAALAVELGLSSWGQGLSCERPLSGARLDSAAGERSVHARFRYFLPICLSGAHCIPMRRGRHGY